jgi:hypothetical protein
MGFMDGYKHTDDVEPIERPQKQIIAEVPYAFGDIVYHRAGTEGVRGIVNCFVMTESEIRIGVVWGDDLQVGHHYAYELTDEYVPQ